MNRVELLMFAFKKKKGLELTLNNTSGLFNHHVWCVVQGGISL